MTNKVKVVDSLSNRDHLIMWVILFFCILQAVGDVYFMMEIQRVERQTEDRFTGTEAKHLEAKIQELSQLIPDPDPNQK